MIIAQRAGSGTAPETCVALSVPKQFFGPGEETAYARLAQRTAVENEDAALFGRAPADAVDAEKFGAERLRGAAAAKARDFMI